MIAIRRDQNKQIIPYDKAIEKVSENEIYIRHGQLNSEKMLDGIGRKVLISP